MKNIFKFFAVALVMFTVISCDKNEILPNNSLEDVITLSASIGTGDTKTSLGNDFSVLWSEGDAIAVIQGNNVFEFSLVSGAGTTSGVFICENHEGFQASQAFQAFYPYRDNLLNEDGNVDFGVVARQNHLTNTFNIDVAPMAAYSASGTSLTFANLFSVLKLQLKGITETVRSIEVTSMTNANLCGPAVFSFSEEGMPALEGWKLNNSSTRTVILDCGEEGVQLKTDEPTDFMIMIPPGVGQGWAVVIKTDNNTYYKSSSQSHNVASGKIVVMQSLDLSSSENVNKLTANSYVENGVYLGEGIKVDDLYWAPVNCGYEKAIGSYKGYTWGKLYQWGRDSGCGFSDGSDDSDASIGDFTSSYTAGENWSNDPCPDGWRVPKKDELGSLTRVSSAPEMNNGQEGYWYGSNTTTKFVFFPAAGYRIGTGSKNRRSTCIYWSSTYYSSFYCLNCKTGNIETSSCSTAYPVRCVKDVAPMPS